MNAATLEEMMVREYAERCQREHFGVAGLLCIECAQAAITEALKIREGSAVRAA